MLDSSLYSIVDSLRLDGNSYSLKYTAPKWASGFDCPLGKCGACCITDSPVDLRKKKLISPNLYICSEYDYDNKMCLAYSKRPVTCIIYPFLMGAEENEILVSPMLSCPGTRSMNNVTKSLLSTILSEPRISEWILRMMRIYDYVKSFPTLWEEADSVWGNLRELVNDTINRGNIYPISERATKDASKLVRLKVGIAPTCGLPSLKAMFDNLFKTVAGFIVPFGIKPEIWITEKIGDSISFRSLDNSKTRVVNIPSTLPDLEFEDESKGILSDYLRMLLSRPYLQLASLRTRYLSQEGKMSIATYELLTVFIGSLYYFEISAGLIAMKNETACVDALIANELIAFCDSIISGAFYSPQF